MADTDRWRVLVVDDSADDIELLRDSLYATGFLLGRSPPHLEGAGPFRGQIELQTASSGEEALDVLRASGPFAVLISDMRMPGIDGIALLRQARTIAPETVRMVVTGLRDQGVAAAALNDGQAFRFIRKPVSDEQLAAALIAALEQYALVTAERELLSDTLRGALVVLSDILALTRPAAFGRASRIRGLVRALALSLGADRVWELELAAVLSQIGMFSVGDKTVQKVIAGAALTPSEILEYRVYPRVGADLLARIPRLGTVSEIIRWHDQPFSGVDGMPGAPRGRALPLGSRLLKIALDYDALVHRGASPPQAIQELQARTGRYDTQILAALARVRGENDGRRRVTVPLAELWEGAEIAELAEVAEGEKLIILSRGTIVSATLLSRLQSSLSEVSLRQTVMVLVEESAPPRGEEPTPDPARGECPRVLWSE